MTMRMGMEAPAVVLPIATLTVPPTATLTMLPTTARTLPTATPMLRTAIMLPAIMRRTTPARTIARASGAGAVTATLAGAVTVMAVGAGTAGMVPESVFVGTASAGGTARPAWVAWSAGERTAPYGDYTHHPALMM